MSTSSASEAEKLPTQGLVGGKYEIVRLIGRGGMGSVWEAKHATLGTRVAIKFVDVEQAQNDEARRRFENEARAAATIESKHAIKVHDHGFLDDGRPYIVMELLVGEPLDRRLDQRGRLPLPDVARIVQQVARALEQAHDAGITHRDLKPDNIFLVESPDDDDEVAKVLDFGIAKITDPAHALGVSSSTKTGVLMGTPFYMSPEQARGLKTVDHRSDLWALAIIVFRCVTGALPFTGVALGDLLVKICASPIPVPSSVFPGASPELDAWMAKALEREPDRRFQSARELADSLAMVAGITVRPGSRRSDGSHTPPRVVAVDLTMQSPGLAVGGSDAVARPAAMVTSSPITTSSVPPTRRDSRVSVLAASLIAVAALIASGAVTMAVIHRATPVSQSSERVVAAAAPPASSAPPPVPDEPASGPSARVPQPPDPQGETSALPGRGREEKGLGSVDRAPRKPLLAPTSAAGTPPVPVTVAVPIPIRRPAPSAALPAVVPPKPAAPPLPLPANDPGY